MADQQPLLPWAGIQPDWDEDVRCVVACWSFLPNLTMQGRAGLVLGVAARTRKPDSSWYHCGYAGQQAVLRYWGGDSHRAGEAFIF